ncbi:hypothetical protein L6R52_20485 [Myxococcota bacterium]|nr:hypothetical protein [Myxococcota bacterium]
MSSPVHVASAPALGALAPAGRESPRAPRGGTTPQRRGSRTRETSSRGREAPSTEARTRGASVGAFDARTLGAFDARTLGAFDARALGAFVGAFDARVVGALAGPVGAIGGALEARTIGGLFGAWASVVASVLVGARRRATVFVHEHGAVITSRAGERVLRFGDVARVFVDATPSPRTVRVETITGATFVLTAERRAARRALAALIARVTPLVAPRAAADFWAGEDVDFGRVTLSRARIALTTARGTVELGLDALDALTVGRGHVAIHASLGGSRPLASVPLAEVANVDALGQLVAHARPAVVLGPGPWTSDRQGATP